MTIGIRSLRSKVARRFLVLFITSALLPVAVLATLSVREVENLLHRYAQADARSEAKTLGMVIYERLTLLLSQQEMLASRLKAASPNDHELEAGCCSRFKAVWLLKDSGPATLLFGQSAALPNLTGEAAARNGRPSLWALREQGRQARLFVSRALDPGHPGRARLLGEVDTQQIWGDIDNFGPAVSICIVDQHGRYLVCSVPPAPALEDLFRSRPARSAAFAWEQDGESFTTTYWPIFLEAMFSTPQWTVAITRRQSESLASLHSFRNIFLEVVVATILIVSLLSVIQIRRNLVPLERLIRGTRSVANQDFTSRVVVTSGDEFEQLAQSFNTMTERLGTQFQVMAIMAEIDRLILSNSDVRSVLDLVLTRISDILPCDYIGVILAETGNPSQARIYVGDGRSRGTMVSRSIDFSASDPAWSVAGLRTMPESEQKESASYLAPLARLGATHLLILPIVLAECLTGVLMLAYRSRPSVSEEEVTRAKDFADRLAVALSKAVWEEQIKHQAYHDYLTGLPNRLLLGDRFEGARARAQRHRCQVALLFIDLDRFKLVNDSLGHSAGDRLINTIARRLSDCMREVDTVARLGGDEFIIVVPDLCGARDPVADLAAFAARCTQTVSEPVVLEGHEIRLTASIGIAIFPRDGDNLEDILKNADSAMYHAKAKGKNNYQFYSKALNAAATERLDTENALRLALDRGELELFYQPQVDARSTRIVGAEALLRWRHPTKGLLGPGTFIDLAEETGLIVPIGEWVLRAACAQASTWKRAGMPLRVSLNLSSKQFYHGNLIDTVRKAREAEGLDAGLLGLEITEQLGHGRHR